MLIRYLVAILLALLLLSCGDRDKSKTLASVNGKSITKTQFDAYLKFKRVPAKEEKRVQRLLDQYLEREAFASVRSRNNLTNSERRCSSAVTLKRF